MVMRMQPCSSPSPLHLFLLLAPFAVSACPLHAAAVAVKRTTTMQPQGRSASPVTPELSADQSSNLKNPHSPLQPRDPPSGNGAITTFDDGLVMSVTSGVATNPPEATRQAISSTQNPPIPPQNTQLPPQAAPTSSAHQTSAAAQPGNGNTNTVTTSPVSSRDPAALPGTVSAEATPTTTLSINAGTKSTPGRDPSVVPNTTALSRSPFASVFTTVDSNGRTYTTSVVLSSTSGLPNTGADAGVDQVDQSGGNSPSTESPSGRNPPFFSQPAAAAGVIIAAIVAALALCGVIILILRHRKQKRKQGELQSIHSNSDYPHPPHQRQTSGSSFSAGDRHSFRSDRSSTYEWHANARAELEAMQEVNRTAVTYHAPPTNNGAPPVAPNTYPHVQTVTAGKDLTRLSTIQEAGKLSPFADHEALIYAPADEPVLTLLTPFPQHATNVPSRYVDVPRQQYSTLLPNDTGLVPLVRAPPLRMRSRSSGIELSTPSGSSSTPLPLPRVRTASAPGSSRTPPPRWNNLPLLKRTPQLQSLPSPTGNTSTRNPFTDPPSLPSRTGETEKGAQVLQERLKNPFVDEGPLSEDEVAVANAHASYFSDFNFPELELGLGLGSSRASIEDVLGVNASASVLTITEHQRGPGVVVPRVTVQAPSNEDGISLLSSEVDSTEMMQSLDEEHLFYNGGPRGHASLSAVGVGRK